MSQCANPNVGMSNNSAVSLLSDSLSVHDTETAEEPISNEGFAADRPSGKQNDASQYHLIQGYPREQTFNDETSPVDRYTLPSLAFSNPPSGRLYNVSKPPKGANWLKKSKQTKHQVHIGRKLAKTVGGPISHRRRH